MRRFLLGLLIVCVAMPALAEDVSAPPANAKTVEESVPVSDGNTPTYEAKKFAILQTLDKVTARTRSVTVPVGKAISVGPLFLDVKSCQKTPPTELPESAAFIQVWEAVPKPKIKRKSADRDETAPSQWVFSGWMFASSPALSAMNHPIYDVWLKDCVETDSSQKTNK